MKYLVAFIIIAGCGGSSDGPDCDPDACAAAGGACAPDEVCEVLCTGASCGNLVRCPAGLRCHIDCAEPGACSGGIDCGAAYACTVRCAGTDSCSNEVTCGNGPCLVTCSGANACDNGVTCRDSCACDVLCTGNGSCGDPAVCPSAACNDGPGCLSELEGCNVCD